jgi:hypothetical protein
MIQVYVCAKDIRKNSLDRILCSQQCEWAMSESMDGEKFCGRLKLIDTEIKCGCQVADSAVFKIGDKEICLACCREKGVQ